jgi:hypothetical protein
MAVVTAALRALVKPGSVLVMPADGVDELRWHPHLGRPPGPLGRRGRPRVRPRISTGVEDADDLVADVERALDAG